LFGGSNSEPQVPQNMFPKLDQSMIKELFLNNDRRTLQWLTDILSTGDFIVLYNKNKLAKQVYIFWLFVMSCFIIIK